MTSSPRISWQPPEALRDTSALARFAQEHGLPSDYRQLHRWSVDHSDAFWGLLFEHFDLPGEAWPVAERGGVTGKRWFPRAEVNYAEQVLRGRLDDDVAIQHQSEVRPLAAWSWRRLRDEVKRVRSALEDRGVGPGDRVVAYMPNLPETMAAFLATASLGAIWSSAAPEFGVQAVVDRFAQITPKVLLAVDGYRYNGRDFDRSTHAAEVHAAVGGALVRFGHLDGTGWPTGFGDEPAALTFRRVAFEHPLWVLFSSGTTGLPKAIVHGQGGMLLEHLKYTNLHLDARAEDRVFWFTTTGWMMWNFLAGVLLGRASVVLYDGAPDPGTLWDLAAATGTTIFGTSAAFLTASMRSDERPRAHRDLRVRAVGSTGSPLAPDGFRWVEEQFGPGTWLFSMSGGTDVCTAFLAGIPIAPVYEGELQGPALGADVQAWDEAGRPVIDEVGELVLASPMPCMPVGFWNDPQDQRYRDAYFAHFDGVWRHGDWVTMTSRGTAVVHGRSDATINRGGVRMGTAEIYAAVASVPEVLDALVVDVVDAHGGHWLPMFVVLRPGTDLDDHLRSRIARAIREHCSPRHVPDDVRAVTDFPKTLSGKTLEVPIKRLLAGADERVVVQRELLQRPDALDPFVELAAERRKAAL